jgi:hypothetical protein
MKIQHLLLCALLVVFGVTLMAADLVRVTSMARDGNGAIQRTQPHGSWFFWPWDRGQVAAITNCTFIP